eukprot:TRINITY_DN3208_c0_g1_i8.p1 TRINITY_DN3208_c0_g1~~TRINITY_DN3208_c0_g1_i8.p1  ORF type:complete len:273 (-),score=58.91 TRINITY_DN3208_c0_g1_i8:322-1104(-)
MGDALITRLQRIGHPSAHLCSPHDLLAPSRERFELLGWLARAWADRVDKSIISLFPEKNEHAEKVQRIVEMYAFLGLIEDARDQSLQSGDELLHRMIDLLEAGESLQHHQSTQKLSCQRIMESAIATQKELFSKQLRLLPSEMSLHDAPQQRITHAYLADMLGSIKQQTAELDKRLESTHQQNTADAKQSINFSEDALLSLRPHFMAFRTSMTEFIQVFEKDMKAWSVSPMLNRDEEMFGGAATEARQELADVKTCGAKL